MNDNVLRGFCQKCEWPIIYSLTEGLQQPIYHDIPPLPLGIPPSPEEENFNHIPDPVWFLSPKQMKIVENYFIANKNDYGNSPYVSWARSDTGYWIIVHWALLLEQSPFLVAKILKECEKE